MFLQTVVLRNRALIDYAFKLHQQKMIQPDTYILDIDAILENARKLKVEADLYGIDLFFMTKQIGRNPYISQKLIDIGYTGAVVVDYREAQVMMKNNIPIAHAGHLVQIPQGMLDEILAYGVSYLTLYSLEKARSVNTICQAQHKKQKIFLKVVAEGDYLYPGQESGIEFSRLEEVIKELKALENIEIAGVTTFPCFLYDEKEEVINPVPNMATLLKAKELVEKLLDKKIQVNMPSCTQIDLIKTINEYGGTQGEPGNSLAGTTPNNRQGKTYETPAIVYVSEVSHQFRGKSYCYGGGYYRRGKIDKALIGKDKDHAKWLEVEQPNSENIDYYLTLLGDAEIGSCAMMSFRTQIFATRSQVVLVEGLSNKTPRIVGLYDSQGTLISQ